MDYEEALSITIELARGAVEMVTEAGMVDSTNPTAHMFDLKKSQLAIKIVEDYTGKTL